MKGVIAYPDQNKRESIKDLITKKDKHLLWQDELGDCFLIFRTGEIYESPFRNNCLRLITWSIFVVKDLKKRNIILNQSSTDDGLYILDIEEKHLALIIKLWGFKRRPEKNSWVKKAEKRLGHRILKYEPVIFN